MRRCCTAMVIIMLIVLSCGKEDVDVRNAGYDYYPLEFSNYITYNVTEIIYDDFSQTVDTGYYLLKERTDSAFIDLEGRNAHKILRYRSELSDTTGSWLLTDVWTTVKDDEIAERVEENVVFIRLDFPLRLSKSWNGNARNDSAPQNYLVRTYDLRQTIGGRTFEKTCNILQADEFDQVKEFYAEEVYARGTGLVYRRERKLKKVPGDVSRTAGYDITWVFAETGKE